MRRFSGNLNRPVVWVPVAAVIAAGAVLAGTVLASASGPALPRRTPAQLIAAMQRAKLPAAATATVTESANLGFPALPDIAGMPSSALSAASWLSGSHTVQIWYDGADHVRIALPVSFGETDLRVNGSQVWLWDSRTQTATHIVRPAAASAIPRPIFVKPPKLSRACLRFIRVTTHPNLRTFQPSQRLMRRIMRACLPARIIGNPFRLPKFLRAGAAVPPSCAMTKVFVGRPAGPGGSAVGLRDLSPIQLARRLLALLGPTTKVSVAGTTTVAGRSAYELAIAPRTSRSLIAQIVIAVDATTYLPLQVQVFARGSSGPAFSLGFTALSTGRPAMSNFVFTPPPGAHIRVVHLPDPFAAITGGFHSFAMPLGPAPALRARVSKLVRVSKLYRVSKPGCPLASFQGSGLSGMPGLTGLAGFAGPRVIGSGWLSVLALPASPAVASFLAGGHPAAIPAGPAAQYLPWLHTLLNSAARVHGPWGSGRLLRTALFSVLVTSKGQVLAGAVTPDVLIAAASRATTR